MLCVDPPLVELELDAEEVDVDDDKLLWEMSSSSSSPPPIVSARLPVA